MRASQEGLPTLPGPGRGRAGGLGERAWNGDSAWTIRPEALLSAAPCEHQGESLRALRAGGKKDHTQTYEENSNIALWKVSLKARFVVKATKGNGKAL